MLTLVGLGLFDERDLTLRGLEATKNADKVYIELYTGRWGGSVERLSKTIGKDIVELFRKDLEENSSKILDEAKNKKITILVQGDPLVATTHNSLLLDARKKRIKTEIIHNASIVSAIAETGLHIYKFGPSVTIPFPEKTKGKAPESIFEIIKANKKRGLHTLCLLDVVAEEDKYMTVTQGLRILSLDKMFAKDRLVVFSKAGSNTPSIFYDTVSNLIKKDIKDIPSVIIIPGKLHFTEKEFLE